MNTDKLTVCSRCSSDACYSQEVNDKITSYQCYGCGFQTNTLMTQDSDFINEQSSTLPELYKDLTYEDEDGKLWLPSTINLPKQGMVFANGKTSDSWKWSAVKAIEVKEEEKEKYPNPKIPGEYYKFRMDMSTMKEFEERDYMDALSYIGVLPE
tara:strand:+ start:4770 stop:5231 length:462 start_codon:yes stop_codon:yes gene_type:complete